MVRNQQFPDGDVHPRILEHDLLGVPDQKAARSDRAETAMHRHRAGYSTAPSQKRFRLDGVGRSGAGIHQDLVNNRHGIERAGALGRSGLEGRLDLTQQRVRGAGRRAGAGSAAGTGVAVIGRRGMVMTVMMMAAADRLRQVLDARELAALRGVAEIRGKLIELRGRGRIALLLGSLRGGLQVGRDLLGDLLVFGRVGLLQLLQFAHYLSKRRKLGVIRLLRDRRSGGVPASRSRKSGTLKSGVHYRLEIGKIVVDGTSAHALTYRHFQVHLLVPFKMLKRLDPHTPTASVF